MVEHVHLKLLGELNSFFWAILSSSSCVVAGIVSIHESSLFLVGHIVPLPCARMSVRYQALVGTGYMPRKASGVRSCGKRNSHAARTIQFSFLTALGFLSIISSADACCFSCASTMCGSGATHKASFGTTTAIDFPGAHICNSLAIGLDWLTSFVWSSEPVLLQQCNNVFELVNVGDRGGCGCVSDFVLEPSWVCELLEYSRFATS